MYMRHMQCTLNYYICMNSQINKSIQHIPIMHLDIIGSTGNSAIRRPNCYIDTYILSKLAICMCVYMCII